MNYCGIDLGGMSSYVHLTDDRGSRLWSGAVATTQADLESRLKPFIAGGLAVAIEAGNQTAWIYQLLVKLGAKVTVVNPNRVKLIAESRCKTDKVDARILCELLRLNGLPEPVHMPGPQARSLRGLLAARRQLVSARSKLINVVRGMLRQEGLRLPARGLNSFAGWQRVLERGFAHEHVLHIVAAYYTSFVTLTRSIRELDAQLALAERGEPRSTRLRTMPKVGRIGALTFLAAVDDVHLFSSSRKLVAYSGLAPTVRQSSDRACYGSITRQGRSELRAVWVQIAQLVANDRSRASQPLRSWYRRIERKRGRRTAVVALARRLLSVAYHLLRYDCDYDASRLKRRKKVA
jgi:transposase